MSDKKAVKYTFSRKQDVVQSLLNYNNLFEKIGHRFSNLELFENAITPETISNSRLVMVGKSVIQMTFAEKLYHFFPRENDSSKINRQLNELICDTTLAQIALDYELGSFLRIHHKRKKTALGNQVAQLSNSLKSLVGAIHIEAGKEVSQQSLFRLYDNELERLKKLKGTSLNKPKSELRKLMLAFNQSAPIYKLVSDQRREFSVECYLSFRSKPFKGQGPGVAHAEHSAAQAALTYLNSVNKKF